MCEPFIIPSVLLSVALLANCGGTEKPVVAPEAAYESEPARYTASQFFETLSIRGTSFNHDESKLLVTSDESGVFNVYSQPVTGGERTPLSRSTSNATYAVSYFPKDDRFLYVSDEGGNEQTHLHVMTEAGKATDLTPSDNTKSSFLAWSGDKASFYVLSNERDPKQFDLYRYQTQGYAREMVFQNSEAWIVEEASPDGKWVALTKVESNVDSNVFLWNSNSPSCGRSI